MKTKPGVQLSPLRPTMAAALPIAEAVYRRYGYEITITATTDGRHMPGSLHYSGQAVDLRTVAAGIPPVVVQAIAADLRKELGNAFDVVVERDHIHLERDPRKARPATEQEQSEVRILASNGAHGCHSDVEVDELASNFLGRRVRGLSLFGDEAERLISWLKGA